MLFLMVNNEQAITSEPLTSLENLQSKKSKKNKTNPPNLIQSVSDYSAKNAALQTPKTVKLFDACLENSFPKLFKELEIKKEPNIGKKITPFVFEELLDVFDTFVINFPNKVKNVDANSNFYNKFLPSFALYLRFFDYLFSYSGPRSTKEFTLETDETKG